MIERPAFHPRWRVVLVPGDAVFFVSSREQTMLGGQLSERVVRLIDGKRSSDAIADRLERHFPLATTYYALLELERRGWIIDSDTARTREQNARGRTSVGDLAAIAGGRLEGMRLVVAEDYLDPRLAQRNRESLERDIPWMLVGIRRDELWVGPLFVPATTPCWECFAHRHALARPVDAYLAARIAAHEAVVLSTPASPRAQRAASDADFARMATLLAHDTHAPALGTVLVFDRARGTVTRHHVGRRPQCPACGTEPGADQAPFDVTRKTRSLADVRHALIDPMTGIIASADRMSPDDAPFPIYVAAPMGASTATLDLQHLRMAMAARSGGTGVTKREAFDAALGEATERYCGTAPDGQKSVRASLNQLGRAALHPNNCMLFSDDQYHARRTWNALGDPMARVPKRFDERAVIDWTPAWSLSREAEVLLPTAFLYFGVDASARGMCVADGNGCAAGESLPDAIVRGFLELVERDAVAIWWYSRARRPEVDIASLADGRLTRLARSYQKIGRKYWVLDVTSDLGIPVCAAITCRTDGDREEVLFGFGAHFDRGRAALKAVAEMNQMVAAFVSVAESRNTLPPVLRSWLASATIGEHSHLLPSGTPITPTAMAAGGFAAGPRLAQCREIVEARGMELIVCDQTRPDVGVAVVKVIVPGLRPAGPRLAPGRLYDVPARLGWVAAPLTEKALNPSPLCL